MTNNQDRFLRMPEVLLLTGLSKAHIYSLISKNQFPKQLKIGERASAWLESSVCEWMDSKILNSEHNSEGEAA